MRFVRERDGKLQPEDSYLGRWLGAKSRIKSGELSGEGKHVIGIHGRCGERLDGIGLVLAPSPAGN